MNAKIEKLPATLYHYCTPATFVAIVESSRIRLGRLSAMNDFREFTWIRTMALKELPRVIDEAWKQEGQRTQQQSVRMGKFRRRLEVLLSRQNHCDPYCACFSASGDILSQWRAYAQGGEGFAIGFRFEGLQFGGPNPLRIDYSKANHLNLVRTLLRSCVDYVKSLDPDDLAFHPEAMASIADAMLTSAATAAKNPKFKEEKEYRIVHTVDRKIDRPSKHDWPIYPTQRIDRNMKDVFDVTQSGLRHYLELEFDRANIRQIVLGPRNSAKRDQRVLRMFLAKHDLSEVEIRRSRATLR